MATSASVAKLSIRHEAILHFLIANPTISKGEVAIRFNVTEAWLSVVCNSQAFIEARANYTEQVFHETVLPMREKLIALADKTLDRLSELVPVETDLDKVRKTSEGVLAACGFSSSPSPPSSQTNVQINNFGNASPEVLARARERIGVKDNGLESNRLVQLSHSQESFARRINEVEDSNSLRDSVSDGSDVDRASFLRGAQVRIVGRFGSGEIGSEDLRGKGADECGRCEVGRGEAAIWAHQADLGHNKLGSGEAEAGQGSLHSNPSSADLYDAEGYMRGNGTAESGSSESSQLSPD